MRVYAGFVIDLIEYIIHLDCKSRQKWNYIPFLPRLCANEQIKKEFFYARSR